MRESEGSPFKNQSIPRLELCSALLLCKLINNVKHAIHIEIDKIRAWSDSMVVLYWLRGDVARWKTFVSNCVSEISEILSAIHWNHVKGSENPADLISRGVSPAQLKDNSLWWNGSKWLSYIRPITSERNLDLKFAEDAVHRAEIEAKQLTAVCNLIVPQLLVSNETINTLITNCSTFTRIERILAYCIRFLHNCRKGHEDRELFKLTLPELELSRHEVLKHSQRVYFAKELKCLQNKREPRYAASLVGFIGSPRKIYSDNANFVGAKRELQELYAFLHTSINGEVGDALQERGIEWSFIPPYSPHLEGLWEAGVKSCKYHLRRIMGNALFTFKELTTSLVQIEACLNSRPLSPLSSDLEPLTPGHFLIEEPLTSLPDN
ncbi:PREDICTED: uncharacterized protein LOC105149388 [Acromyrmex echinatior]|uniref:uncharacterized protein LOC105149388 n=1 Tax=Acromyrmex echinatior TaxID=103372 RepID=UPI000580C634|nr:PREDICTED: uncharacterized protein LOC105149388 [Acromyrmex echinatior]